MLFLGVGAVMFTATIFIGGWVLYDQFWGERRQRHY